MKVKDMEKLRKLLIELQGELGENDKEADRIIGRAKDYVTIQLYDKLARGEKWKQSD